ncbi:MAG: MBL fold metallo-hydrolase, partial [Lachnospiraceae bacterium]|nr:MBL fold metallo-hydrolase [Lachnospiraceae bacterium]
VITEPEKKEERSDTNEITYVLNTKTKKFHKPSCSSLPTVNRKDSSESREDIIAKGYVPCKRCNP